MPSGMSASAVPQLPAAVAATLALARVLRPTPPARALARALHQALAPPVPAGDVLRHAASQPAPDPAHGPGRGLGPEPRQAPASEHTPLLSRAAGPAFHARRWPPARVTATLALTALLHVAWYLGWAGASYAQHLLVPPQPLAPRPGSFAPLAAWAYILFRTLLRAQPTPSYDSMLLLASLLLVPASALASSPTYRIVAASAVLSLGLIASSLYVQLQLPLCAYPDSVARAYGLPLRQPDKVLRRVPFEHSADQYPAPDEVCTLWQWMSNSWVQPLIALGTIPAGINHTAIWNVATPTLTRFLMPVWDKFPRGTSIWWRIALVNRRDLLLDFVLTVRFPSVSKCNRCIAYLKASPFRRTTDSLPPLALLTQSVLFLFLFHNMTVASLHVAPIYIHVCVYADKQFPHAVCSAIGPPTRP